MSLTNQGIPSPSAVLLAGAHWETICRRLAPSAVLLAGAHWETICRRLSAFTDHLLAHKHLMDRLLGVLGALQEDEEAEEIGEDADRDEDIK